MAGYPDMTNQNVASGEAHVDQQIGAIFGDAAFHRYESVYHINQGDPPDRRYRIAVNHLEGGDPRHAETILHDLLRDGHATPERLYYYVLAMLSDRSLNEVDGEIMRQARRAFQNYRAESDGWRASLEVVWQLLWCMWQQVEGRLDKDLVEGTVGAYTALPPSRQSEISRHLEKILSGLVQNRLAEVGARWVVLERMEPRRVERAWKFFQPDPAQPRKFTVVAERPGSEHLRRMWLGGLGFAIGLTAVPASPLDYPVFAILGVLLLGAGGYLAVRNAVAQASFEARLGRARREHTPVAKQPSPHSPGHWVSTQFVQELFEIIDRRFAEARPHIGGDWVGDTSGIKANLKVRLLNLYGNAQVPASAISWLARWHAHQAAAKWREGRLFDYGLAYAVPGVTTSMIALGGVIAVVGLAAVLVSGAIVAAFLLGVGGYFLGKGAIVPLAARRVYWFAQVESDRLYQEEVQAYEDWNRLLLDRPSDAEMARWLALDKAYLKASALGRFRLTDQDLVDHVVITEGAPRAQRARVLHGPPRYSVYVVHIFLLTKSGVRQITVDLDFLVGKEHNERRKSFRYDALASASVEEKGFRIANYHGITSQPNGTGVPLANEHLSSRSLKLTLVGGEEIAVTIENFRNLSDTTVEDEAELTKLAMQTSGVGSALHVLEAVAAEGRDWIARENERRQQWSRNWDAVEPDPGIDLNALMTDPNTIH